MRACTGFCFATLAVLAADPHRARVLVRATAPSSPEQALRDHDALWTVVHTLNTEFERRRSGEANTRHDTKVLGRAFRCLTCDMSGGIKRDDLERLVLKHTGGRCLKLAGLFAGLDEPVDIQHWLRFFGRRSQKHASRDKGYRRLSMAPRNVRIV